MKTEYRYGLIIGIASILWVIGEYFIASTIGRPDLGNITSILSILIPLLGLIFALRKKRQDLGEVISLKQLVKSGTLTMLIAGIITGLFIFIALTISPDLMETYYSYLATTLPEQGLTPEEVQSQIDLYRQYGSAPYQAFFFITGSVISGILLSFIIGLFLRKKPAMQA